MDQIINNQGFQHILEKILLNLNGKALDVCSNICHNFNIILSGPSIWIKKLEQREAMTSEEVNKWRKVALMTKETNLEEIVVNYLRKCVIAERNLNVFCFINKFVLKKLFSIEYLLDKKQKEDQLQEILKQAINDSLQYLPNHSRRWFIFTYNQSENCQDKMTNLGALKLEKSGKVHLTQTG